MAWNQVLFRRLWEGLLLIQVFTLPGGFGSSARIIHYYIWKSLWSGKEGAESLARQMPNNLVCLKTCSTSVLALCGKFFGRRGGYRSAFCQKMPEAACWTEPVPAGFKTEPSLAKAEPMSNVGSTSVNR